MLATLTILHGTEAFSWSHFDVHPSVLIGCVALAGAYLVAVGPLRSQGWRSPRGWRGSPGRGEPGASAERIHPLRVVSFLAAVVVIFLALNGPIHELSDSFLFSAHMLQHMLLMLVMPPLLLLGLPAWLLRPALARAPVARSARALTHPVLAFVLYNIVFIAWHLPRFYNWALSAHDVHIVQHLMFMVAATLMWWPVVNPVPELQRLPDGPLQMMYLFALAVPASIVSALITFSDRVLYPFYEAAPRVMELSALDDQRLGGLMMWIPGMLIFWIAITAVYFRWTGEEIRSWGRESQREDPAISPDPSGSAVRP